MPTPMPQTHALRMPPKTLAPPPRSGPMPRTPAVYPYPTSIPRILAPHLYPIRLHLPPVVFVLALTRFERGETPFESVTEQELLQQGLKLTLGLSRALPTATAPTQSMWQLLLIVIWGDEGHWALLLLKAALLRTQIDFELLFDIFEECLPVVKAQVRAIAALLFAQLQYEKYDQQEHLRDLDEHMEAMQCGDGNVWILPAGVGALFSEPWRADASAAVPDGMPLLGQGGDGVERNPGDTAAPLPSLRHSPTHESARDAPRAPAFPDSAEPDPRDTGTPASSPRHSPIESARDEPGAPASPEPAELVPRSANPLSSGAASAKALPHTATEGSGAGGTGAAALQKPPAGPDAARPKAQGSEWMWITLEDEPSTASQSPAQPRGPALPRRLEAHRPSTLLLSSLEGHVGAAGAQSRLEGPPDTARSAVGTGILDLSKCWGAAAVEASATASPALLPPQRGVPLARLHRGPRLQWVQEDGPKYSSLVSPRQCIDGGKVGARDVPELAPLTSSIVKELLVTDYGIDLDPRTDLGACGACVWDRGICALGAGRIALAGACFAAGHAPVPPLLLRGIDPHGTAWAQFWIVYYAWALGHAAVLPELQSMVRAKRSTVARRTAGLVRLLPLCGGAAAATTVNTLCVRSLRAFRPRFGRGLAVSEARRPAALATFVGSDCAKHAKHDRVSDMTGAVLYDDLDESRRSDPPQVRGTGTPPAVAQAPAASPLPPMVNGLLGFPDTLFVGPTYDAAQRKTGSVFRPFHSVEDALRLVRPGQTVALLPGLYAPLKVRNVQALHDAPVRLLGLGRAVVTVPHKLRGGKRTPLIKVRDSNNLVIAGLQLRTYGVGIDIGNDCFNISLEGLVIEDTYKACEHPVAKYHNIRLVDCLLNERQRSCLEAALRRLVHTQLRHRWVYVGVFACPDAGGGGF